MADWATVLQRQRYPAISAVTNQRISDWRRGKSVPQRFETLDPVLRALIKEALRRKTPPAKPGMYELQRWRQWWKDARTASDTATGQSTLIPDTECPYQGLAAFQATDQTRFFGRTRAVQELVAFIAKVRAADPGVVLLTGPSGAGKSSLLSAGLIPAASSGALDTLNVGDGGWVTARMTPGNDPMAELVRRLEQPDIKERADGAPVLIIVDQGEELFAPDVSPQSRAQFLEVLHTMSQPSMSTPRVVVMGLRSDALGRCVELPELAGAVQSRCIVLGPMSNTELRDVVTKPAKMAGLRIEPRLVDLILHDVTTEKNSAQTARLPLLSHVLASTWRQRQGSKLTVAGYKSAGGLRGSVETTGEKAWGLLDEEQRGIARRMLLRLVTISEAGYDSCRKEPKHELLARFPDDESAAEVLETLTAARLLTIDGGDVTFTHEIVLRAWVRLAGWIEDDRVSAPIRQRAEADATTWMEHGRRTSFLQTGARLQATVDLLDTIDADEVDPFVAEFAEASRRRQRRVTRTKWGAVVVVFILAVACASMAFVAFRQRSAISRQYDTAVFNQVLAAADARQVSDPSLSAQLVMVAQHLRPNDNQVRSRLLTTQNMPLSTLLTGHSGLVSTVTFSPDGNLLASASWDNTIRLWDTANPDDPKPVGQPLQGHTSPVSAVAFSPDGKTLASSSADNTVRLWDLTTPTDVKELTAPLPGGGEFRLVAFSPNGRTLATLNDARTLRLWDVTNKRAPHAGSILSGHTGPLTAIAFSPNGHILASASNDKTLRLWDVTDPTRAQEVGAPLTGFTDTTYAVAFDPAGSLLAATGGDGVILLWNVTDPAHPVRSADQLPAHNATAAAFSPDGTILASGSYDIPAKLWNLIDPAHPVALGQPLADPRGGPGSVAFRPDGRYLATGSASGTISLWTLPAGLTPNHVGAIRHPGFSGDGTVMVTASGNVAQLWTNVDRLTRAATLRLPDSSTGDLREARVDPSGRILATALGSAPTVLWDISDITKPIELGTLPNISKFNSSIVAFAPDGRTVATAGDDNTVQLWDIAEPRRPQRLSEPLTGCTGFISAVRFSPDGRTLVASSADRTVRLWDISDRDHPRPAPIAIIGQTATFASPSISPDSKTLAVGGQEQTIRLWDISDPLRPTLIGSPLHSPSNAVQVVFSPDGKTLASGSNDGSVLLWDVSDLAHPAVIGDSLIPPGVASTTRVSFDPHGRLYVVSGDGTIRIFDLDTDNTKRICASTRNVLTEQRWNQVLPDLRYNPPCR